MFIIVLCRYIIYVFFRRASSISGPVPNISDEPGVANVAEMSNTESLTQAGGGTERGDAGDTT